MTSDDITERIKAEALGSGEPRFDPITIMIIGAVISTVVSWAVTKCLDSLTAADCHQPGLIARWRLQRKITQALREAKKTSPITMDDMDAEDIIYHAVLAVGRQMTEDNLKALRASA